MPQYLFDTLLVQLFMPLHLLKAAGMEIGLLLVVFIPYLLLYLLSPMLLNVSGLLMLKRNFNISLWVLPVHT